jgi:hypothetical protein
VSPALRRSVALATLGLVGGSNALGSGIALAWPRVGEPIAALGRVALASPAPKVFCRMGAIEPFAREHHITVRYADGGERRFDADDRESVRLPGPYALRNVYGAALVFATALPARTTTAVVTHGVCDGAASTTFLDAGEHGPATSVVIESAPRTRPGDVTRVEVPCTR